MWIFFSYVLQAAILQQTAEYVCVLERERTQLLSQNCQLKRQLDLSDSNSSNIGTSNTTTEIQSNKKRKFDNVMTMQTISDSADEGLGSMSPEPVAIFTVLTKHPSGGTAANQTTVSLKELRELKHQLEVERRNRIHLEDQVRQMQLQGYPERISEVAIQYQHQEVIEHTDSLREEISIIKEPYTKLKISDLREIHHHHHHHPDLSDVQVLSVETVPPIGQTQVVVCSSADIDDDDERTMTPVEMEKDEPTIIETTTATTKARLQPILEAVSKAEPKVEVERINSPASITVVVSDEDGNGTPGSQSRMFRTSTSRQNLETIVEAIRHLEGDSLFEQDAPLALTKTKPETQRHLQVEMNSFLQFRTANSGTNSVVTNAPASSAGVVIAASSPSSSSSVPVTSHIITHQHATLQQQQCRPGVIVGKQNS